MRKLLNAPLTTTPKNDLIKTNQGLLHKFDSHLPLESRKKKGYQKISLIFFCLYLSILLNP